MIVLILPISTRSTRTASSARPRAATLTCSLTDAGDCVAVSQCSGRVSENVGVPGCAPVHPSPLHIRSIARESCTHFTHLRHFLRARERLPPQHSVTRQFAHHHYVALSLRWSSCARSCVYHLGQAASQGFRAPAGRRDPQTFVLNPWVLGSAELRIPRRDTRRKYGLGGPEVPAFLMSCGRSRITKQRLQATPMPQVMLQQSP